MSLFPCNNRTESWWLPQRRIWNINEMSPRMSKYHIRYNCSLAESGKKYWDSYKHNANARYIIPMASIFITAHFESLDSSRFLLNISISKPQFRSELKDDSQLQLDNIASLHSSRPILPLSLSLSRSVISTSSQEHRSCCHRVPELSRYTISERRISLKIISLRNAKNLIKKLYSRRSSRCLKSERNPVSAQNRYWISSLKRLTLYLLFFWNGPRSWTLSLWIGSNYRVSYSNADGCFANGWSWWIVKSPPSDITDIVWFSAIAAATAWLYYCCGVDTDSVESPPVSWYPPSFTLELHSKSICFWRKPICSSSFDLEISPQPANTFSRAPPSTAAQPQMTAEVR